MIIIIIIMLAAYFVSLPGNYIFSHRLVTRIANSWPANGWVITAIATS